MEYNVGYVDIAEGTDTGLSANSKIKEAFNNANLHLNNLNAKLQITDNQTTADLNTLLNVGIYDIDGGANTPTNHTIGRLTVTKHNQSVDIIEQSYVTDDTEFTRKSTNAGTSFSDWVKSGISEHRSILSTASTATQEPAGLGLINAIIVNFGTTEIVTDEVTYNIDGTLTFHEAGQYILKYTAHYGRSGSVGTSILAFRMLKNDNQIGNILVAKIDSADSLSPWEGDTILDVASNDVFKAQLIRDSAGNNSGGLFSTSTDLGASPSCSLTVYKIK